MKKQLQKKLYAFIVTAMFSSFSQITFAQFCNYNSQCSLGYSCIWHHCLRINNCTTSISANSALTFCKGDSVTLTSAPANTYQWSVNYVNITGANSQSYLANSAGTYRCRATKSCGTATSAGLVVTVDIDPTVNLTASGTLSFCYGDSVTLTANTAALQFQWKKNGVNIAGATFQTYVAKTAGVYKCKVTNTCGHKTSNANTVTNPCRISNENTLDVLEHLSVYPNPATNSVTIKFPSDETGQISIVNLYGQLVFSEMINVEQTQIDVSQFPAGMYVIRWGSGENFESKTFSITK